MAKSVILCNIFFPSRDVDIGSVPPGSKRASLLRQYSLACAGKVYLKKARKRREKYFSAGSYKTKRGGFEAEVRFFFLVNSV
ncbi:MAG: hypothetical protein LBJ95_04915 [Oscillospiraceae bacterium]|nr:hypothetical protein [Oscillospiraceae bacterium]